MRYVVTVGEARHIIELDEGEGRQRRVTLDGRALLVDWSLVGADYPHAADGRVANHYSVLVERQSFDIFARTIDDQDGAASGGARQIEALLHGRPFQVYVQDERTQALATLAGGAHVSGDAAIRAPMPGLVSNVLVVEGEEVRRGQTLVALEAMKMENDLTAPRAGVVKVVRVAKGQTVNQGDTLVVVGDRDGDAGANDGEESE